MDITYLKEFEILASKLNFTEAANAAYVSQPVLSKHIRALEAELGLPLFERNRRNVKLTRFGSNYLKYARKIIAEYDNAEAWRREYVQQNSNSLLIGLPESLELYEVNDHLHEFGHQFPKFNIETTEDMSANLVERFTRGDFNLFLTGVTEGTDVAELPFGYLKVAEGEIMVCMNANHPLSKKQSLRIEELANERIIIPPSNSLFQVFIEDRFFKELGYRKDFMYGSYSIALTLAESVSCIALMQQEAIVNLPVSLIAKPLSSPITYSRGIGYRLHGLTEAEKSYLEYVKWKMKL